MTSGVFGDYTASTVFCSVTCSGNESGILDCSYLTSTTCYGHNAAVICQGEPSINFLLQSQLTLL